MEKWEKIIDDLDRQMDADVAKLVKNIPNVSRIFYDELLALVMQLKLKTGKKSPKASEIAENLKKLQGINAKLNALLMDSGYKGDIAMFLNTFNSVSNAVNDYYTAMLGNFNPSQDLFEAIRKSNISTTADSLLVSGVNANFIEPVKKILRDVITGNGSVNVMREQLTLTILGNSEFEPKLKSYVNQVASDSIRQFQRQYIQSVSADLGLKHYFYRGTATSDTREFCQRRHGKYFTEEQVKGWAAVNWQGKAKGTNETTIFTYCGGYNCRHTILPVSETIYKARVK